jgi:hypothetical protein
MCVITMHNSMNSIFNIVLRDNDVIFLQPKFLGQTETLNCASHSSKGSSTLAHGFEVYYQINCELLFILFMCLEAN